MLRAGGSLFKFLGDYRKSRRVLSWMAALKWASDIASGMEHLRSHNLVHLDLKSPNVLLTKNSLTANAKICDFGNLRRTPSSQGTVTMSGVTPMGAPRELPWQVRDELNESIPIYPTEEQTVKLAKALLDPAANPELGLARAAENRTIAQRAQDCNDGSLPSDDEDCCLGVSATNLASCALASV